jgi:hypothetical protein
MATIYAGKSNPTEKEKELHREFSVGMLLCPYG